MMERDRGGRRRRETRERDGEERQWRAMKETDARERRGRGTAERDEGGRHQETPHPHSLAPPHTYNASITVLPQIHLNVEVLLVYLYMLVARQESAL